MEFKVGQEVRVRKDLKHREVYEGIMYVDYMGLLGKTALITKYEGNMGIFLNNKHDSFNRFSSAMLEPIEEVIEVGDTVISIDCPDSGSYDDFSHYYNSSTMIGKRTVLGDLGNGWFRISGTSDYVRHHKKGLKLIKKGANKMEKTMVSYQDLLNKGAQTSCDTFKLAIDTYGSRQFDILEFDKLCKEKGEPHKKNSEMHRKWFPEAFREERTYKVGDRFQWCWHVPFTVCYAEDQKFTKGGPHTNKVAISYIDNSNKPTVCITSISVGDVNKITEAEMIALVGEGFKQCELIVE